MLGELKKRIDKIDTEARWEVPPVHADKYLFPIFKVLDEMWAEFPRNGSYRDVVKWVEKWRGS